MKTRLALVYLCLLPSALCLASGPPSTAFTYQGRLDTGTNPANGSYDLTFTLFSTSSGGSAAAGPLTNSATAVSNGLFTVTLDYGAGVFGGANYWLEIGVRTNGGGSFTTLAPRQQVTPSPYAIYASDAGAASTANSVSTGSVTGAGIAAGQVVKSLNGLEDTVLLSAGSNITITPNGNTLTIASTNGGGGGSGWSLTGNTGTIPGTDFLGTSDNEPLELWVNGARALRLEPGPNVIGGASNNLVSPGNMGDTIGGGVNNSITGGNNNGTTIAGGTYNTAPSASSGTVSGGYMNTVSNQYPTVSGGEYNTASANGAVVGGGLNNIASGRGATVVGGAFNTASGAGAFVGGGGFDGTTTSGNSAANPASTVGGGLQNAASGNYATVGGGSLNTANGLNSTVAGGYFNAANGDYSFAAGQAANAQNLGAFVWADNSASTIFSSTANNQFSVRANGGVRLVTGGAGLTGLTLDGYQVLTTASGGGGGGGGITNGWLLTGNANANPANGNFLGTIDTNGLELRVDDARGLRLDYASRALAPGSALVGVNVNAGDSGNTISDGVIGGTIAGGGTKSGLIENPTIYPNIVTADFGAVGGGNDNTAGYGATVPGGYGNIATGNGSFAAGRNAHTTQDGSFIWSDGTQTFTGSGADSFDVLATGEVGFYSAPGLTKMRIAANGYVGINENNPTQQLEVNGKFMLVDGAGNEEAYLGGDGSGNDVQIGSLNPTITAVSCYNAANSSYMHLYCSSITITGGADLAEPFQISSADKEIPQGAVVVIDEENPGHLKVSDRAYDSRVAGVVSGANGINPGIQMQQQGLLEGGKNVALTGRVYVQADATAGPIKPGDLLTSSATPGHAMKVSDHAKAQGAILGKAMTGLNEGTGMVLVLVTLQ